MDYEMKPGDVYKHFKGNHYEIVAVAEDCEDGSPQVVYKALYPPYKIYVRPYFDFVEELDSNKYPKAEQKHRFEKAEIVAGERKFFGNLPGSGQQGGPTFAQKEAEEESDIQVSNASGKERAVDEKLLLFLSGNTFEEQISVLKEMKGRITGEMFAVMFASLDFPMPKGNEEDCYNALMKRLETMHEFDGKRFRI